MNCQTFDFQRIRTQTEIQLVEFIEFKKKVFIDKKSKKKFFYRCNPHKMFS